MGSEPIDHVVYERIVPELFKRFELIPFRMPEYEIDGGSPIFGFYGTPPIFPPLKKGDFPELKATKIVGIEPIDIELLNRLSEEFSKTHYRPKKEETDMKQQDSELIIEVLCEHVRTLKQRIDGNIGTIQYLKSEKENLEGIISTGKKDNERLRELDHERGEKFIELQREFFAAKERIIELEAKLAARNAEIEALTAKKPRSRKAKS